MNFLKINKNNQYAWDLRCEIIRKRANLDTMGNGICDFCGKQVPVLKMKIGVYYKKSFPLWFSDKNNYICCQNCNPPMEKKREIKKKYPFYIDFTNEDIKVLIEKQERILKNHRWKIKTINH